MTGPYGHKPDCLFADEREDQVSVRTSVGTAMRVTFVDGKIAALDHMLPDSKSWRPSHAWYEDVVRDAVLLYNKGFWPCTECGGLITKPTAAIVRRPL